MRLSSARALLLVGLLVGCEGPAGPAGPPGTPGEPGDPGSDGGNGNNGRSTWVVGTGLKLEVTSAAVDAAGKVTVGLKMTDAAGKALDREGNFSESPVSVSLVLARLGQSSTGEAGAYAPYTTRSQTSPITT